MLKMLRGLCCDLVLFSIFFCVVFIDGDLFAQSLGGDLSGGEHRASERNFSGMRLPSGMLTMVARSYNNSIEMGLPSAAMIFEGVKKEELRKALDVTESQKNEIETFRAAMQIQIVMKIPELIKRFNDSNENDNKAIQVDLESDIKKFIDKVNSIVTPEQQAKAKILVFQATGGLNSPLVGKDTLDILGVTGEQREKAEIIIEQAKAERDEKLEELMKVIEERVAKGRNISKEERDEIRKKRETLISEILAIGKKTGDRLKGFLNKQQQQKAEELIADVPDFLPRIPMINNSSSPYIPNPDSWQPGQGVPDSENEKRRNRKTFPRKNRENL
ncbi:MAG: hypothetical protein LBB88_00335 [Planctomycetaceae bacterium]|jgi:hypothetical protein|nr:hypothetical protein [Planctomycetaceae bacterium]